MTASGKQRAKDLFPPTKERSFRIYQRRTYRVNTGCLRNRLNLCVLLPVNAFSLCAFCSCVDALKLFFFAALLVKIFLNIFIHKSENNKINLHQNIFKVINSRENNYINISHISCQFLNDKPSHI
jgi:hypothetical protein